MDVDLKQNKFTWMSSPKDGIVTLQKMDRILVNWGWREMYPHAIGVALTILNSDHSPIVLHPNPPTRSPKFFRYERMWEEHED